MKDCMLELMIKNIKPDTTEEIRDYWVFGLCPSFDILKNTKGHVSETGSVYIFRREGKRHLLYCICQKVLTTITGRSN
jgi:hypothetical protein